MMLSAVLLLLRDREHPRSGIWLALGILIKPLVGGLLILFILRRRWRVVGVTIVTLGLLSLLTILVFGLDNFTPYFLDGPMTRLPANLYLEGFYQSLYSIITKFIADSGVTGIGINQTFLILAMFIVIITIGSVIRMGKRALPLQYALLLLMALLLYPHTQVYYTILLFVPLYILWNEKTYLTLWPKVAFITATYTAVASASLGGNYVFVVLLSLWLLCVYLAFRVAEAKTPAALFTGSAADTLSSEPAT